MKAALFALRFNELFGVVNSRRNVAGANMFQATRFFPLIIHLYFIFNSDAERPN